MLQICGLAIGLGWSLLRTGFVTSPRVRAEIYRHATIPRFQTGFMQALPPADEKQSA